MQKSQKRGIRSRLKFILGGLVILAAIIFLIVSATQANAEYFLTVNEVKSNEINLVGKNLRISGAVVGSTVQYDPQTMNLSFEIAHVPGDNASIEKAGGLAAVLHNAVVDPARARMIIIYNGPKPDLLQDEAQAIITGQLGEDGIFHANELLLKCPTKYQEAIPNQATDGN